MYADQVTDSMRHGDRETQRRRQKQLAYNLRARHRPADHPQEGHRHPRDGAGTRRGRATSQRAGERARSRAEPRARQALGRLRPRRRRARRARPPDPDARGGDARGGQGAPLRGGRRRCATRSPSSSGSCAWSCSRPARRVVEPRRPGVPVHRGEHPFDRPARRVSWEQCRTPAAPTITIRGAREHNLKNVDLELPREQLIVFTGLSGSGKSSLAFDTIYAEGQRRYVESLSAYARQFLGQMDKPDVDFIEGLSPAISIDQKSASRNPRSTVGHDHRDLRLPAAPLRAHRRPALPELRAGDHAPDAATDRRPGARAARRHPVPGAGARRPRPQGRVRGPAEGARGPGLHAGPGRRRGPRPHATSSGWPATSSTRSRSSSTGWCGGRASNGASPTRWRPPCASPTASPRSRSSRATATATATTTTRR